MKLSWYRSLKGFYSYPIRLMKLLWASSGVVSRLPNVQEGDATGDDCRTTVGFIKKFW